MYSAMFAPLFSQADLAHIFSDAQFIAEMVRVEVALAKVEARLGIIPALAAERIAGATLDFTPNHEALQNGLEKSGVPTIELIRQFREHVGGEAASYVHWGATTQDIMDTVLVLQLRDAAAYLESQLSDLIRNLAALADVHRHTLMAGRTHSQHALPITFGLKVVGWLSPLLRHRIRLREIKPRLLVVQFSGAAGTLASLNGRGLEVQTALAEELGLGVASGSWHTGRDTLAELANWLSLVTGSLGKMATDIILMAQSEVDELSESDDPSRGGSSTMPQKQNPIISEVIVAIARSNAAHLSAMHQALLQEHERATGGWQIEWLTLPQMVILTGAALKKALLLSENLVVNVEQMRHNVEASNGLMLAEALDLALTPHIGRTEAKKRVKAAAQSAIAQNRHLVDVVREQVDVPLDWDELRDEKNYLGVSEAMINRVLQDAKEE